MALLKAFVLQVVLFGLYKLFLEQVVEQHLVPDELKRNILVGLIGLLCFGIQLYTDVEEQTGQGESSKSKNRRKTSADTPDGVSEFMDYRTADMMRRLDAAMQRMNQMPTSDGYVQTVIFASAGPEATVVEQTFVRQADVVRVEEVRDVTNANEKSISEPIVVPVKVEEVSSGHEEEEVEEEESETKSDVCEEEEEDVVTVIDASKPEVEKPKPKVVESEEEEDEEEEEAEEEEEVEEKPAALENKKNNEMEEASAKKFSKQEEEEEEEEESEEEEDEVKQDAEKVARKS